MSLPSAAHSAAARSGSNGLRYQIVRIGRLLKDPPLIILQAVLNRIPGRPFQVARILILELNNSPLWPARGVGHVRLGTRADVIGMSALEGKHEELLQRLGNGDHCLVACHEKVIVAYAWFSTREVHYETRLHYNLPIPPNTLYGYDAFIRRDYRMRGVWLLLQHRLWQEAALRQRDTVRSFSDLDNDASLKAHTRLGYEVMCSVTMIRCGRWRWFREGAATA